jgi:hypothetical protein
MRATVAALSVASFLVVAATSPRALAEEKKSPIERSPLVVGGALIFGGAWLSSSAVSLGATIQQWGACQDAQNAADAANARANSPQGSAAALQANVNEIVVCGNHPAAESLWIPIAGPWVALSSGGSSTAAQVALVGDGVVQAAGLGMLLVGLVAGELAQPSTPPSIGLTSGAGGAPAGITVFGRF